MKPIRERLSYSNVVATVALFVALGGVSYAAVHLPKGSVDTAQLRNGAVSTRKLRDGAITEAKVADGSITTSKLADEAVSGAKISDGSISTSKVGDGSITTSKLADGAVTGAKVNTAALGTVPSATSAQYAARADQAVQAEEAEFATEAEEAEYLAGLPASAFGGPLIAHTNIPATTTPQEWWIPVSGFGEASHEVKDVEMFLPGFDHFFARGMEAFVWTGPGHEDAAKVHVSLHNFEQAEPFHHWEFEVTRLASSIITTSPGAEFPVGARLAYKIVEEPNGEEIPAIGLQTALYLSPSP